VFTVLVVVFRADEMAIPDPFDFEAGNEFFLGVFVFKVEEVKVFFKVVVVAGGFLEEVGGVEIDGVEKGSGFFRHRREKCRGL